MKRLWVAVALAPLTFAASAADAACTTTANVTTCQITGSTTAPISTATVNAGAAANIDVTGSVIPTTTSVSAAAVTLNSSNTVTNAGSVGYSSGVSNAIGVQVSTSANYTGEVINTGSISLTESTTGDASNQGYTYGPYANGTSRYGIYVATGAGTFTGVADAANTYSLTDPTVINNSGTISITGENSAGIYAAGNVDGDILNSGTISVTGGDSTASTTTTITQTPDVTYGILTTGHVTGVVDLTGSVTATGQNAVGVALNEGAGGLILDSSITATGYRTTTNPGLTIARALNAEQVEQGGPAIYIGGSITNGVDILAPVAATSTVAAVAGGTVTVYGSSPAILIGADFGKTTTIGLLTGTTNGTATGEVNETTADNVNGISTDLLIGGTVSAQGVYDNRVTAAPATETFDATAIQVGGTNNLAFTIGGAGIGATSTGGTAAGDAFGAVVMNEGIDITGTVEADAFSITSGHGNSTGILIGDDATVGSLNLAATAILSANTQTAYTLTNGVANGGAAAIALNVQSNGSLATINNAGVIEATISPVITLQSGVGVYTGGQSSTVPVAIKDSSGTITSITNENTIEAAYLNASNALINPSGVNARGIALDLSANTAGVTVTQKAYDGTVFPTGVTSITPTIVGDILFGSGAANLNVSAGTVTGNIFYGASNGNALTVSGGATVTGGLSEVTGGQLALNVSDGSLVINAPTSVAASPTDGSSTTTAITNNPGTIGLSSLNIGSTGALTLTLSPTNTAGDTVFDVAGATSFSSGAKINVLFSALPTGAAKTYTLVAGATPFTTTDTAAELIGSTPYLLAVSSAIVPTGDGDSLEVTAGERTAAQLTALTPAERSEYGALYSALASDTNAADSAVLADLLSKTSLKSFKQAYDQFLPDFSGGPFAMLEAGQEAIYRTEDDVPLRLQSGERRGWVQEIGFLDHRDNTDSAGYDGGGFGMVGGLESGTGDGGAVGVTAAYLTGNVKDAAQSSDGHLAASVLEAGAYWRSGGSGLNFDASVNGGWAWFDSDRLFLDQNAPDATSGSTATASQSASSKWNGAVLAAHLGVKAPFVAGRFYVRPEIGVDYYALYESAHTEHGGGADYDLSISARTSQEALAQADLVLGMNYGELIRWRPELTLGYREVVEGGPGTTSARFGSGGNFALNPEFNDKGGVLARLGIRAGGAYADFSADAGGVYGDGTQSYDARAAARFLF